MIKEDEIKEAQTYRDYLKFGIPKGLTLNTFLDWRNQLVKLKKDTDENQSLYDLEIKATDYIIQENFS